ncbi:MAG: prolyl oligopeptidase family serine peptidase, partial [Planctomycetaceae bacterium]|nr:prolyl oligopeptidase family serine peptidase [Planctomycetaceae bacterium]
MKKIVLMPVLAGLVFSLAATAESKSDEPAPKGWDEKMRTVQYPSPIDNSLQPAVIYIPESAEPVPLLVTLHTWGGDYRQPAQSRASWCIEKKWALIAPNFRGPNTTPQGCGSELAVADIVAAVEYMKKRTKIDKNRIYLMGGSGGGYGSLLMAGRHPEIWAGVSAWCGITDLKDWYYETSAKKLHYADNIVKCCGGKPGTSEEVDKQYLIRSANTKIHNAVYVPLDINHGIHDGHTGSVPVSHSIKAFNLLAAPDKRISDAEMQYFCTERKVPEKLKAETETDPLYGSMPVLFRRISGNTRLTIFDGGHS